MQRGGGRGRATVHLPTPEFLPPPEGFWTVVFYLSNVCKYYHLQTENNLSFHKIPHPALQRHGQEKCQGAIAFTPRPHPVYAIAPLPTLIDGRV